MSDSRPGDDRGRHRGDAGDSSCASVGVVLAVSVRRAARPWCRRSRARPWRPSRARCRRSGRGRRSAACRSRRRRARRLRDCGEAGQCLGRGVAGAPWSCPCSSAASAGKRPAAAARRAPPEKMFDVMVLCSFGLHSGRTPSAWWSCETAAARSMRARAAWRSASAASSSTRSRVGRSLSPRRNDFSKKPRDSRARRARRSAAATAVSKQRHACPVPLDLGRGCAPLASESCASASSCSALAVASRGCAGGLGAQRNAHADDHALAVALAELAALACGADGQLGIGARLSAGELALAPCHVGLSPPARAARGARASASSRCGRTASDAIRRREAQPCRSGPSSAVAACDSATAASATALSAAATAPSAWWLSARARSPAPTRRATSDASCRALSSRCRARSCVEASALIGPVRIADLAGDAAIVQPPAALRAQPIRRLPLQRSACRSFRSQSGTATVASYSLTAVVACEALGLGPEFERRRLRGPALSCCQPGASRLASSRCRAMFGLACPGGVDALPDRRAGAGRLGTQRRAERHQAASTTAPGQAQRFETIGNLVCTSLKPGNWEVRRGVAPLKRAKKPRVVSWSTDESEWGAQEGIGGAVGDDSAIGNKTDADRACER